MDDRLDDLVTLARIERRARASIDPTPAAAGPVEVLVDGGFTAAGLGRTLAILAEELTTTMANLGCPDLASLTRDRVRWSLPVSPERRSGLLQPVVEVEPGRQGAELVEEHARHLDPFPPLLLLGPAGPVPGKVDLAPGAAQLGEVPVHGLPELPRLEEEVGP